MPENDLVPMNSVSLRAAQRIIDAAITAASGLGVEVCIAVCDPSGTPIITVRMDAAPRLSAEIALNKAYSVAVFKGIPTDRWWPLLADDPALVHGFPQIARLVVFAGGVPILFDGVVVGAVGVSGASTDQDRQIAQAGADTVGAS